MIEQIHDEHGKFVGMCKFDFMSMEEFCGYEYGKFCGGIFFYWSWNFDYGKFLVGMRFLVMENFLLDMKFFGHGKSLLCM